MKSRLSLSTSLVAIMLIGALASCGPRLDSDNPYIRQAAVAQLTDQTILAKVAIEDKDSDVRIAAIEKLTDQTALAKVALGHDSDVRIAAIKKLTDQAVLAKLAFDEHLDSNIRIAAIKNITDQALLAIIALKQFNEFYNNSAVYEAIVEKITDKALLAKVSGNKQRHSINCIQVVAALNESDPILKILACSLSEGTNKTIQSIARIKLAVQEPRIKSRFPRLQCVVDASESAGRWYSSGPISIQGRPANQKYFVDGENVTIKLQQDGRTLAEASWSTFFPDQLSHLVSFLPADVSGEDLIRKLLHLNVFTSEDLAEFSIAAKAVLDKAATEKATNLTDQAILVKVAIEDKNPDVRLVAIKKITDPALLAKVVLETKYSDIHIPIAVIEKLVNQAALAKAAIEVNEANVRQAAVMKLTDQALLAKIATEDKNSDVRVVAIKKLTDQAVLAKIARETLDLWVRRLAEDRIKELAGK